MNPALLYPKFEEAISTLLNKINSNQNTLDAAGIEACSKGVFELTHAYRTVQTMESEHKYRQARELQSASQSTASGS